MADKKLNIKVRADGARRAKKDIKGVETGITSLGKAAAKSAAKRQGKSVKYNKGGKVKSSRGKK